MPQKFRILYISSFSDLTGGGQKSLLLLLQRLNRKKISPVLLCPARGELVEKVEALGIESVILKIRGFKGPKFLTAPCNALKLKNLIRNKNIDLIHTDAPRYTFYGGLAAKWTGKLLVWHVRVSTPESSIYERLLFGLSTEIIAVSEACKQRFKNFSGYEQRVKVIYNGVDTQEFHPGLEKRSFREELRVKDEEILVGIIGRLHFSKGHEDFLKASQEVTQRNSRVKFVIVGKGDQQYQNYLKSLVDRLNLKRWVKFTGSRKDIHSVIAGLDILVNASQEKTEGFSRIIIEAMAAGVPVIATKVEGNPEAVDDLITGILISPENPSQLAEAILDLAGDEKRREKMGIEGRMRAEDLFSIEENVRRTEKIYEELMKEILKKA